MSYKILYVNGTSNIGGAEVSLLSLLKEINKDYFCPIVVVPTNGLLTEKLKRFGIEAEVIRITEFSRRKFLQFLVNVFRLAFFIRKKNIKLVQSNSIYVAEQSFLAAKLAGVPCICHVRDLAPVLGAGMLRSMAFKNAQRIIAISEAVKKDLVEKLRIPENKIIRIYNGVDTKEFSPDISTNNFRDEFMLGSKKLVGMIGRFSPEKGQEFFLKAAAEIIKENNEVIFIFVGDAKLGSEKFKEGIIDLSSRLNLKDNTLFVGFRDDLPNILPVLDMLVVPSRAEPFGRVIIEAFACGVPVIAANSGATPEIISKDSGILIEPNNIGQLKQSVIELLKNPLRAKQMGQEGRKIVLEKFNISKHVLAVSELYREIICRRRNVSSNEGK
ncbi:MAG: glycosyltransferase family 4 protein [Candidatus Omnitrophica bacterium]|nr:glycosyltransferase family 4 protein [Candidatus Omnitrophota bacterium]